MSTVENSTALALARNAVRAEAFLKLLANGVRLRILCTLMEGERTVGDLAEIVDLAQSAVSQHLMKMRQAGLVEAERRGQTVIYRLSSMEARALLSTLYLIFCATQKN